jgi:hypothetical protein
MSSRKMMRVVLLAALAAVAAPVAYADRVTSQASQGKQYVSVTAETENVYCFILMLQTGTFHLSVPPKGWSVQAMGDSQVRFWTTTDPICPDNYVPTAMFTVKATGGLKNTLWETRRDDGSTTDWGTLDLK